MAIGPAVKALLPRFPSDPLPDLWLRSLNDVRLSLGVVLGITEDYEHELGGLDPQDPRGAYLQVYDWLTYLQETLVRALR